MRRGSGSWVESEPGATVSASLRCVGRFGRRLLARRWVLALGTAALPVLAILVALAVEIRTSALQAWAFHRVASELAFRVEPGVNPGLRLPRDGPYDLRLGYAHLDRLILRLLAAGYRVTAQAHVSGPIDVLAGWGLVPVYAEKARGGLRIADRGGRALYEFAYPRRIYESFEDVPDLVVTTLLFVENRELLEADPRDNPAIEWDRLARALWFRAWTLAGGDAPQVGGSTLATQLEKFRHSPAGRTEDVREKLRQIVNASLRAYRTGPDTTQARRQIVVDYLDSLPLAAAPGHSEAHGLGDGLWAWFDAELREVDRALADPRAPLATRGLALRRVLGLILAARRPSGYLLEHRPELEALTDSYLRLLHAAGVVGRDLRDAALAQRLGFRAAPGPPPSPTVRHGGADLVRGELAGLLGVTMHYDLDRLDLSVRATLDGPVQQEVGRLLQSLGKRQVAEALELTTPDRLADDDPSRVVYGLTLYERRPGANVVRVQADSGGGIDPNALTKLDLGSTAKLRALITYLDLIAGLHARFSRLSAAELRAAPTHPRDRLAAWARDHLVAHPGASLAEILDAAMERRYSANPDATFFTGGGRHRFGNFSRAHDTRTPTVREGFRDSVNLVFIRLMRDVVDHHVHGSGAGAVLDDAAHPRRAAYLARFADEEGTAFLRRFYRKYEGVQPADLLARLLRERRPTPRKVAVVLGAVRPDATVATLRAVVSKHLPDADVPEEALASLHRRYTAADLSLADRAYLAGVHPLELWLAGHLRRQPSVTLAEVLDASRNARQDAYRWLFRTRRKAAQDQRIATLLEVDAFAHIHRQWARLGYPFASLTPSLATAIGSSADRPTALTELVGIIVNGGVRYPIVVVDDLRFGAGTPYETHVARASGPGDRVLSPELAAVVRGALVDVVADGTARALRGPENDASGRVIGGKTGTGDHRRDVRGQGGTPIESRAVSRSGMFVFLIDDRFFGAVTAYVHGPRAADYDFTSGLAVRLLRVALPLLAPVIEAPGAAATAPTAASESCAPHIIGAGGRSGSSSCAPPPRPRSTPPQPSRRRPAPGSRRG